MTEEKKLSSVKDSESKEEKIDPEKSRLQRDNGARVPEKFKKLVEEIEKMSVLDLAELVKILEKKFGVSAASPVIVQATTAAGAASGGEDETAEKTIFNIELKEVGEKKIEVIKVVRDITQKGLKEAKDLVDAVASGPQMIKENVKKEEAEEMKKKLEEAGAKIELK